MENNATQNIQDVKELQSEIEKYKKIIARNNIIIVVLIAILIFLIVFLGFRFIF